jgi:hypothetical protein
MDFAAKACIISHGGRTLATVEAGPLPYEMSDELDTLGPGPIPVERKISA